MTELGPWKSSVPLKGARVVGGMRGIMPTSGGGDASPPGLVSVNV